MLKKLQNAQNLLTTLSRLYSTKRRLSAKGLEEIEVSFKENFDSVIKEFQAHNAMNHPFFDYLKEQSKTGFNTNQFRIYRDNFCYRTELTIPSVARTIEKAFLNGDFEATADTISNLYDEGGYGDPNKVHGKLLLDSHNAHGQKIFCRRFT